jgi:hypothetical protein
VCDGYTAGAKIANAVTTVGDVATQAVGGSGFMDRHQVEAMNRVHDQINSSGVKSQYNGEVPLRELAQMANEVYDLHGSRCITKPPPRGWSIQEQIQQPNYSGGYPANLAMAVYEKGNLAVLAFKGTDPGSASDCHADVTGVIRGEAPARPLMAAVDLIKRCQARGKIVMVTGHSLGAYMAEVTATHVGLGGAGFCTPSTGWHAGDKGRAGTFINIRESSDAVVGGGSVACSWANCKMQVHTTNHGRGHGMEHMVNHLNSSSLGNATNMM